MIQKIRMQNFESHEDTEIEFTEGMNLIVGQSNSGKSSILRALRMVVDNEWNKDMVRNGYEYCRVRVTTDKGWVEAERGEKVNRWKCQENEGELQEYKKVGTNVPELATKILGMGQRERGAGIKELPNFQSQLEKHYMLSEIGEKKSTSGLVAVMMDNAIGLGGMEELIKDFSTDMQRDRKWMTSTQSDIEEIKKTMIDETIFESYGKLVDSIGQSVGSIESTESALNTAETMLERHDGLKQSLDKSNGSISLYPDFNAVDGILDGTGKLNAGIGLLERTADLEKEAERAARPLAIDADGILEKCAACKILFDKITRCSDGLDLSKHREEASLSSSIDTGSMKELLDRISALSAKIRDAEAILSRARDIWKDRADAVKSEKALSDELEKAGSELEKLKNDLGICPLCGGKLQ